MIINRKVYKPLEFWNDNTGIYNIFQGVANIFNVTSKTLFDYFMALYPNRLVGKPYDDNYNDYITRMTADITSITAVNKYKIDKWLETTNYEYDAINPYNLSTNVVNNEKNTTGEINNISSDQQVTGTDKTTKKDTLTLNTNDTATVTGDNSDNRTYGGSDSVQLNGTITGSSDNTKGVTTYVDTNFFDTDKNTSNSNSTTQKTETTTFGKTVNNVNTTNNSGTFKQTGTNTNDVTSDTTLNKHTTNNTTENKNKTKDTIGNKEITEKGNKWNYLFSQMINGERNIADFSVIVNYFKLIEQYILLPLYEEEF